MCRISKETAMRACEAIKLRSQAGDFKAIQTPVGDVINVSTKVCGQTYSRGITFKEIKQAYGVSLKSVKGAVVERHSVPGANIKIEK